MAGRIKAKWATDPFANGFWMTVDTTKAGSASDTFVIPTPSSGVYDYYVNWGDGGAVEHITANTDQTHVYDAPGTYTIKIHGTFPRVYFNHAGDCEKLIGLQIGDVGWSSMAEAFGGCLNLASITGPHNTSNVTDFEGAWADCFALTSFPLIDTSAGTNFRLTWKYCGLTSFPLIDTSSGTNFELAWSGCQFTSFPLLNTGAGTNFSGAWSECGLESFPLLDVSNGVSFSGTWAYCGGLNGYDFPLLNMRKMSGGGLCFQEVTLSTASYSNLLIDLVSSLEDGVVFDGGGSLYNASGAVARATLVGRSWDITDGGPE